jgi:KaiC/GvpD/RAD55 family RecA-like ATPase
MKSELSIVKAFLSYSTWNSYNTYITTKDFPEDLQFLYRCLDTYHKTNEEQIDLHVLDLANVFFSQHKKDKEFYEGVFDTLTTYEPNVGTINQLLESVKRGKILRDLSITSYEVAEGKAPYSALEKLLGALNSPQEASNGQEDDFVSANLEDLLSKTYSDGGLSFRLEALRKMLGPLRKGNFGFIFARPETGKTTFLASEITYMAEQLKEGDGPILWCNNEQVDDEVFLRVYQAGLGITIEQLLSNKTHWQAEFHKRFGNKILMPRNFVSTKQNVERLVKRYKPSLMVFDQIDKIKGFDADREDLLLGAIYQWARELAKQYCPIVAVCQADGSGEGQKWLTMANVANAKTAKQAEADWILGIGKTHDVGWETIRFLHLSKNKLMGDEGTDPTMRHGKVEVVIKPEIGRYEDIT